MAKSYTKTMTNTLASLASTTSIGATTIKGLDDFDWFELTAKLPGFDGGTLDVYLQRKIADEDWEDWGHFTQIGSGATAANNKYWVPPYGAGNTGTTTIGSGTATGPGVALAAGVFLGGHPGREVRTVFVTGAGTTGASVTEMVWLTCHKMGE